MPNQWKPTPPKEDIEPHARKYHRWGVPHTKLLELLKNHFDGETLGLGSTTLKGWLKEWSLQSSRKQAHTFDTIAEPIEELRKRFPTAGCEQMRHLLRETFGIRVPKQLIADYNNIVDPSGVRARSAGRIRRRIFYAAGPNHIWALDQHDKWKRFGLRLHIGVETFTGSILWLIIWWSNSNPKLVAQQYIEAARRVGGLPMLTQSDHGTENYNVAYAQTSMRQELDPRLAGTLQHRFMRGHTNIKPERAWGRLRDTWSKGFEDMLSLGITNEWYNPSNLVDSLTFRWLAIPFLQEELNQYVKLHNTTRRRANKNKVLPHGIPEQMLLFPHSVGALDYKVLVPDDLLDRAEEEWAPADDPIFELVPLSFQEIVVSCYDDLGCPTVTFGSFWEVYRDLRDSVDATIPLSVITGLGWSISSESGEGEDVQFTLAHLKAPEPDTGAGADTDERAQGGEEDSFQIDFTIDDDQDQLY